VKTIAITIDEPTLKGIARIAAARGEKGRRPSRSEVIRIALQDYLRRHERREREEKERAIFARHKARLDKQLHALVEEQAEP
jgi:metal-responsive CopG/Arc/MetJ family transcriptional regulator